MFRVPSDPVSPTFDHVFKVGFFRWLTSGAPERKEWRRRRDAAAEVARVNQNRRAEQIRQERNRRLGR